MSKVDQALLDEVLGIVQKEASAMEVQTRVLVPLAERIKELAKMLVTLEEPEFALRRAELVVINGKVRALVRQLGVHDRNIAAAMTRLPEALGMNMREALGVQGMLAMARRVEEAIGDA